MRNASEIDSRGGMKLVAEIGQKAQIRGVTKDVQIKTRDAQNTGLKGGTNQP